MTVHPYSRIFTGKTAAPTVNDDVSLGYEVGDIWIDETNDKTYQAVDITDGAAVWNKIPVNAGDILMPKVGTPTLDTLTEDFTTRGSAGVADGTLTYLTVGSTAVKVSVAAGEGYIRTSNDQQAPLVFCKWSASADLYTFSAPAAETETARFFGISYNAGTPIAISTATFSDFNGHDKFWLGRASYDGTNMEILNSYAHSEDVSNLTRVFLRKVFPFIREEAPEGSGGLELATSGVNQMSMTAGVVHHGFNEYIINAIAAGAQFDTHYKTAAGFVSSTATAWNATDYSTGTALAAMTVNRYGTRWIYIDIGKNSAVGSAYNAQLDMVYGTSNATSVANAQAELAPSIPAHLQYHGRLIGRIIFQKSATSATLVESAWTRMFATSQVGDHSLLSNLQGGTASEYYHLTSADNTEAVAFLNGGTGTHTAVDSHIASAASAHLGTPKSIVFADSPYTILSTDTILYVNTTGGAVTLYLPDGTGSGREITAVSSTGTNSISLDADNFGSVINGAAQIAITPQFKSFTVVDAGVHSWSIVGEYDAQVDIHIAAVTGNPHAVTAAQAAAIPNDGWIASSITGTCRSQAYTNDPAAGLSIALNMADTTGFVAGEYVTVSSSAGSEMAQIESVVANTSITVRRLLLDHTTTSPLVTAFYFTSSSDISSTIQAGHKIKYTQSAVVKYGTVKAVSGTTVTLFPNTNHPFLAAANGLTAFSYSNSENPYGAPSLFDYTPTILSQSGAITTYAVNTAKFLVRGRTIQDFCKISITTQGTAGGYFLLSTPADIANVVGGTGREDGLSGDMLQVQNGGANLIGLTYNNATPFKGNGSVWYVWATFDF